MAGPVIQDVSTGEGTFASDLNQILQALAGAGDVGPLSIFAPIAAPANPTLAAGAAGNPNGTYRCIAVAVTGWERGDGTYVVSGFVPSGEVDITVTSEIIEWTWPAHVAGQLGWLGYRTVAGGAVGTEKFAFWQPNVTAATAQDNVADASLGTGMPTVLGNAVPSTVPTTNTTGSSLAISIGATAPPNPVNGTLWINTSGATPLLEFYDGGWVVASPPPHVADAQEVELTTTAATVVATYTPAAAGNYIIWVYLRVVTATTTVTVTVTYADAGGAQTTTVLNAQSCAVGSYTGLPVYCNAVAGTAIDVNVTAGTANQVYASADIDPA